MIDISTRNDARRIARIPSNECTYVDGIFAKPARGRVNTRDDARTRHHARAFRRKLAENRREGVEENRNSCNTFVARSLSSDIDDNNGMSVYIDGLASRREGTFSRIYARPLSSRLHKRLRSGLGKVFNRPSFGIDRTGYRTIETFYSNGK